MKIILVTSKQYDAIWNHLFPAQRDTGGVPHPVIILRHLDAMLVLRDSVKIGSIEAFNDSVSLQWLNDTILGDKYFEVA